MDTTTTFEIKLFETCDGWPEIGDYLRDDDRLLRVVEFVGSIHTGVSGGANYQYTIVELAPDDIDEDGLTIFGD